VHVIERVLVGAGVAFMAGVFEACGRGLFETAEDLGAEGVVVVGTDDGIGVVGDAARRAEVELDWLCRQQCAPSVKELSAHATSRRSFFRTWKRDLPVSPNDLLRLVRRLQVEDLLARGVPEREVAKVAGFQKVAAMRQFIRR
jgi:AraC-like DNA-binding protein